MGDDLKINHVNAPRDIDGKLDNLRSINSIMQWRGNHQSDRPVFVFLKEGEQESRRLTFGELDRSARSVAAWIHEQGLVGERVLLLYPAGLDFIIGFLGCLYAGAVAVPAYPPHPRRPDPRLDAIFDDCQPKAAFCVQSDVEFLSRQLAERKIITLATDTLGALADLWSSQSVDTDSIAYIQYTSGSTGVPKGVVVTHGNLLHQSAYLTSLSGYDENTVHVNWQPFFHDMGLVGSIVFPIFVGGISYIMAPAAFLRKPIRWLEAMSRYRGTGAPGPNFAFDICVTQTTPEQRQGLDLSSWQVAWNGAEPIRAETLDRFCEVYEPFGFKRQAHLPCYGMAETTLCTTADRPDRLPVVISFQRDELEHHHAVPCSSDDPLAIQLVSSGILGDEMDVAIVEPETLYQCPDGEVGEIWVSGPSVAHGYWQRPKESEETFNAHIAGSNKGPYLRTGDLGFLREGELFVTGRLKDMIIVRGRNVYPHDIELVAQRCHQALQSDCAAFSIEVDGHEEIALALEVKRSERRRVDIDEVFETVRSAVTDNFGVAAHWIGLIQPGRIPKTSSGKIMRSACRRDFLSGDLELIAQWRISESDDLDENIEVASQAPVSSLVQRLKLLSAGQRHQALVTHLQGEIARRLDLRSMPDPNKGFEALGIDSMGAVKLVSHLENQLDNTVDLPTTLLFDQPNIEAVARYLDQELFGEAAALAEQTATELLHDEPVAIVGLACRFPGADDADEFWQVLNQGQDCIQVVPENRWDIDHYFDKDASVPGKMITRFGGFINEIDGFDAAFFDISPREATSMDPQHRHLLEVSWLALEDAGIAPATLDGRPVGVFVGISTGDYDQILSAQGVDGADAFTATGNAHSAAAGRLSFMFGLQGPCVAVDTACSSSLVAIHQAVQSLRLGECEAALVGGVNTVLRPDITVAFSRARLLAPDGRCKTFDAAADGYVRSEGCGMVVLKRLRDAERDGDRVLAVIRGSATNQDGRSSGLTAPNGPSQTRVIANALTNAGVLPADVQYLECHGTGTVLGDPIEVQAANAILSKGRDTDSPLVIGSVKTNLGHMEAAAGIAGLIKVVLALKHGRIPRSLHFNTPNPHIPWESLAVKVAGEAMPWVSKAGRRIAGVSSFGFAGTNAHIVIEEAPQVEAVEASVEIESSPRLLVISARSEEALAELANRYVEWLHTHADLSLADICHTANTGRNRFEHRAVLLCTSPEDAKLQFEALAQGKARPGTARGEAPREGRPRVAFLFPGEGLQYSGMASELYENEPVFRECLDRCARIYDEHARESDLPPLKEIMFHPDGMEKSQQTSHIRPALYALQVSLAALWRSWGVLPDALLGHSAGEYAAACVAGIFSVEEGLKLVMERARLLESLPSGGGMMSVSAPVDAVEAAISTDESVSVSVYNGLNTVISGPEDRLNSLMERFEKDERYCKKLPATNAAHCQHVEPILDDFENFARGIEYSAPGVPLISGLYGEVINEGSIPDATYWRNQTRKPVRFSQGVRVLFETMECDVVLELGPQAELIWLAQMSYRPEYPVHWLSSLEKGQNSLQHMFLTAARLHANGTNLNFAEIEHRDQRYQRLALPTYPFQHVHFWSGPMGQAASSELRDLLYTVMWQPSEAPVPSSRVSAQSWLIISDDDEFATALTTALEARGQGPISKATLSSGATSAADIEAILEQARNNRSIDHAVFVAGPTLDAGADANAVQNAQKTGVERALLVAQALMSMRGSTRLWLVTRGTHAVLDNETIDPTHSPVWGFARTFAVEHPDRFGGLLDMALGESLSDAADTLSRSLLCDDGESQVALRNGQRWLARLQRVPLPDSLSDGLVAEATYLITGGTGALGLALAHHLAKRGAKQIVLSSRSGGGEAVQTAIAELAELGCRIEVVRADIAVASEAERLLTQISEIDKDRPLRGIIHAAGLLEGAPATELTSELLEKVLAPKVWGAWNLHRFTRDSQLDLFVMFSSSAALLGLSGHSNYSAANAFLDSLVQHRRSLGLSGVAINWGPWADDGMATRMEAASWEEIGTGLMRPRTTMQAFDYLCDGKLSHVCVQPMKWQRWSDLASSGRLPPILLKFLDSMISLREPGADTTRTATQANSDDIGPLVHQLAALASGERESAMQSHIRERLGAVLGVPKEKIDREAGFFDLGMNSIMAVELRSALQTDIGGGLDLQAAVIFNHPTVLKLSEYLLNALFDKKESQRSLINTAFSSAASVEVRNIETAELAAAIDSAAEQIVGASWAPNAEDTDDDGNRRRTLAALLALQSEVGRLRNRTVDPVAVVGLSCRYPGARNAEEFWRILDEGRDEITDVPPDRWDNRTYYDADPDAPGKMNTRRGGFITGIDQFDADFFGISPREAMSLDPQQRLVLEVSWEALESANIAPSRIKGIKGGVFIGISVSDYAERVSGQGLDHLDAYGGTGNALCASAGRLSFTLGWQGPALAIDTACSSSLVSLHEACTSLRTSECDIALAGGVSAVLNPNVSLILSKAHMLSPDGSCKTFDAAANGYVRGEGCGMLVLKRLSDAERDGDKIMGLIRGSAVNQDGRSSGLTVPNGLSQERVISEALMSAGVEPSAVQYLECHGTGTPLGDPIEVQAANEVLSKGLEGREPLLIGSVKTNIGHTETAAGVAGVIKVILAMQHESLPKSLHFHNPNPHIPWDQLNVKVITESLPWPRCRTPRIAGVSSFGFVGTNAHIVVEEAPSAAVPVEQIAERSSHVLVLSARNPDTLKVLAERYTAHLQAHSDLSLGGLCHTASTGREAHAQRLAVVGSSLTELTERLQTFTETGMAPLVAQGEATETTKIAFLFTGQGPQYPGMGQKLYAEEPVFRAAMDRCEEGLRPYLELPLLSVMHGAKGSPEADLLNETAYTQPALFALEYALTELWRSWGVVPSVVLGHSIGEYVAACVAGLFELDDALKLIAARGRLMQSLPHDGAMAAVFVGADALSPLLEGREHELSIAGFNTPGSVVLSGRTEAVEAVTKQLAEQDIKIVPLTVSHAFHSPLMEPILDEFEALAQGVNFSAPRIPIISNVSGTAVKGEEMSQARYWREHIRKPVRFAESMERALNEGCNVFLEIGPAATLLGMGRQCLPESEVAWVPTLRAKQDDWNQLLEALGQLWVSGVEIDWKRYEGGRQYSPVSLPTYPFQNRRYWIESAADSRGEEDSKASTIMTNTLKLLDEGETQRLVQELKGGFSSEEVVLLPKMLEVLAQHHKRERLALSAQQDWLYQVDWRVMPRDNKLALSIDTSGETGAWILFADCGGVADTLAREIEASGFRCICVYFKSDSETGFSGDNVYEITPTGPDDYLQLLNGLAGTLEEPVVRLVHMWSLDAPAVEEITGAQLEQLQATGSGSVLHLLQALKQDRIQAKVSIVTRGIAPAETPSSLQGLMHAPLWGLGRAAALECPENWGGMVDLASEQTPDETQELFAELNSSDHDDQVALRRSGRYVARLVRKESEALRDMPIGPEGTYLVTGGVGALGLRVARWLIDNGARNLVLTSRRGATTEVAKKALREFTSAGVKVLVGQADVADVQAMSVLFQQMQASMQPLKGIIHAAGIPGFEPLTEITSERFLQVLRPKVVGTWVLHELTREIELDFFVGFSSISSVWGSMGQAHYAAANHFLDVFAQYGQGQGINVQSVNWGPWSSGGMADDDAQALLSQRGIELLMPDQALELLGHVMRTSASGTVVVNVNWAKFKMLYEARGRQPFLDEIIVAEENEQGKAEEKPRSVLISQLSQASPGEQYELVLGHVRTVVANALGHVDTNALDVNTDLFNIGFDSLMAVQVRNALQRDAELDLPLSLFFEGHSIKELASKVLEQIHGNDSASDIESKSQDSAPIASEQAQLLLDNMDQLSDEEVASLLGELGTQRDAE